MQGKGKTKAQLTSEVAKLRRRVKELEALNSERKSAEKALRESEEKFSQIVDQSSIPTFVIDKDHKVTHWNRACENLVGVSASNVIGTRKQWMAFYATERPVLSDIVVSRASDEEIAKLYADKCRKSKLIEGAYEAEDFFPEVGDSGKWLRFTAASLKGPTGEIIGAIESLQDITERKRAEEEIAQQSRSILELSTPVLKLWDQVLALPLIGIIDTARAQQTVETLLQAIVETESRVAILDVTGVPIIDTKVAQHLLKAVSAAKMLGAQVIITGISPEAAQTITKLGIDLSAISTCGSLRAGVAEALAMVGKQVTSQQGVPE